MVVVLLVGVILFLISIRIILYGRQNYGILENCGFPVIKPTLFLGSDFQFYNNVTDMEDVKRFKKYGRIWGLYRGQMPQVFICDPELIRLILVKNYDHFNSRRQVDFGSTLLNEVLTFLPEDKWKILRSMLSRLFTTSKLKCTTSVIETLAQEYVHDLIEECNRNNGRIKYDCKKRLSAYLIDMFAQSFFGINLEDRKNPDNKFAYAFRQTLGENLTFGPLYSLAMSFPFLIKLAPSFDDRYTKVMEMTVRQSLASRLSGQFKKSNDAIDILNEMLGKVNSEEFKTLGISEMTVISQGVNFFLGGYETSSTTLSHLFYHLVKNPEIQEQLYKEINSKFGTIGSKIDYESIREENTPFLTACLNETLRLAPPLRAQRICTKDWIHEGIRIKKGTVVIVPTWAVSRIPEYFPDPEKFKPERFLPENSSSINQYAFASFGHGPKNCLGIRYAYDSLKTLVVHFLLKFRLEMRPDTVMNYRKGSLILVKFDPLYVDVVQRV